jgi:Hypoxia induced protein conserved region
MDTLIDLAAPLAVAAVAIVLGLGLINMLRGGSANLSQKLMRWRVILQFIAILIVMGVIWLKSGS